MIHTMTLYLCWLADGTQVQAQSPLDSALVPAEDDSNPDHSSDGKPGDGSGHT